MRIRARKPARVKKTVWSKYSSRAARSLRTMRPRTMWMTAAAAFGLAIVVGASTSSRPQDAVEAQRTAKPAASAAIATVAGASADANAEATVSRAADAAAAEGRRSAPVTTLTGCLAREDAAYRLTDPAGDDAPKGRTWKTGFLKKSSRPVDLYDTANRLKLPAHVGQRVSVTGELVDREMYVKSLQSVGSTCAAKS